ncbi:hypothetical protein [Belliella pelovolcani]|uniref:CarboxypepD_reg-like domain-containing protein n=1 Tax=Belliella pelovolcani TaxID=529505 RepID=A0A1N7PIH1_9BACT|nr:hypothetical protein [Belliella pelovolcani]SIT10382.1 hypothetical protein SAMN05421761_11689 [Belliella pelovolcani]
MLKVLWISFWLFSLNNEVTWKAKVMDASTGLPVEGVHIFYQRDQAISKSNGEFSLLLEDDVTIKISHIAYEIVELRVDTDDLPPVIYLVPKETDLTLIEVRPFPSESEFKRRILSSPVERSQLEQSIIKNTSVMKAVYKYIPTQGKGGFGQFLERVIPNGSGGAMFYNSSGGGLLQVFRELKQDYQIPKNEFYYEKDSAKVDQLYKPKYPYLKKYY